ncbi:ergothioneine biosynthesis protein EgtB [Kangiella taiwanensis]|uniref:Ergothioneine biosynthesis protein EgtB n=1 Tax=Kangiella taiwanensis TaxID=1079179 RepID=A0ABP8HZW5_9GAMM|nr:ergothioneine biosynthesis protein EgtB [Kangiella taiwanensis]
MLDKVKPETSIEAVVEQFHSVRALTESLCEHLDVEDYNLQAMPETSPVKWHLAHTSWFFETFILKPFQTGFEPFDRDFEYLFNSYYNAVGAQFPRPRRHLLSRPTVSQVEQYRHSVTQAVIKLIKQSEQHLEQILALVILGINHEQQHQELLLTDLKYNLFQNPVLPCYRNSHSSKSNTKQKTELSKHQWVEFEPGLCQIGQDVGDGVDSKFAFDNESPKHKHYLEAFQLGSRLVTNGEFIEFMDDGGYCRADLWLSDGWVTKNEQDWSSPLYWFKDGDTWYHYTLNGVTKLCMDEPVSHVSFYEADAHATWKGARLPTEQEWERVALEYSLEGNFLEAQHFAPSLSKRKRLVEQLYGELWQWTSSSYSPYPGYQILPGAVGEYNGKFMANQYVLRGGSCVSSREHLRASYRNFFYPDARWQFSGIRLAKNL